MTKYRVKLGSHAVQDLIRKQGDEFELESETFADHPERARFFEKVAAPKDDEAEKAAKAKAKEEADAAKAKAKEEADAAKAKAKEEKAAAKAAAKSEKAGGSQTGE